MSLITYPLKSQGDIILELFLQKQRAACSSCILLDIFNCHQHRLLVYCIWNSSPSRAQWVYRVAVAVCTRGRTDSLDRHPIMVFNGVQCHCPKPLTRYLGFISLPHLRKPNARVSKGYYAAKKAGSQSERKSSWSPVF